MSIIEQFPAQCKQLLALALLVQAFKAEYEAEFVADDESSEANAETAVAETAEANAETVEADAEAVEADAETVEANAETAEANKI